MAYKKQNNNLLIRVGLLTATIFYFAWVIINGSSITIQLILFLLFGFQVVTLIKFLERTHEDLINLLNSFKEDKMAFAYPQPETIELSLIQKKLNLLLSKFKNIGEKKEAEFQYLKNIVQHAGIGLITFDDQGFIHIMNSAAKNLLKIGAVNNVKELESVNPSLVNTLFRLKTGGRSLIRLDHGEEVIQLSIYAIELTLHGEKSKLISIQNIHSELEEKEMEAWQNLVRVLTHEIINSVTPITSLANTIEEELYAHIINGQELKSITNDEIADLHMAIKTIKKRGIALNRFVQDFRNLAQIPEPKKAEANVEEIYKEIMILLKNEISVNGIQVTISIEVKDFVITVDKELVEQVLINIIKNAIEAFDEQTHKLIELGAYIDDKKRPVLTVKDNGSGIEPEAIEKIFIPFFTTKKSGSGIGLSLSRQIMRIHGGSLAVKSKVDEGTAFFLKF